MVCEWSDTSSDEGLPEEPDTPACYCLIDPGTEDDCFHGDGAAIGRGMTNGCTAHAPS